jgi:hypothetical protein
LEKDTIMTNMDKEKMLTILRSALEDLSYAVGVSNHQGSKFTQNKKAVTVIFEELKKRDLFFIDSLTSRSVCEKVAKKLGVKFAKRDIFLDNKLDPKYIEAQLKKLIKKAKKNGSAIGIGHDRTLTLEVLARLMPEFEKKEKIRFVFVSELVQ